MVDSEEVPSKGIPRTGSWDRVVVFDPENGQVDVRARREVQKDVDNGKYRKLKIPKRRKSMSLFVGKNDSTSLKIEENRNADDRFLARLSLDHLGFMNRAIFWLGNLTTLYVSVASRTASS
ncbi:uncharacterized protein K460DRAFT_273478 [Cucurbitaria berberidis CBS 394.84]|uniref:Uncharacterized protein n=1 Tax=Cucurbitaria berberidis CBS 394.84 TaxID=1168544 RepID=A0A9P4GR93_9PLEO|nr:uncharacterized protein K460DRAFT_273478 [Cucurbitaria berberidis CBS 394.84]KAF1851253.1 hypothetical protein K460DRAFT_273478 [Cucurbitaria berberidis CBS 394.84]